MRRLGVVPRWPFILLQVPLPSHHIKHVTPGRTYHVQCDSAGVAPSASTCRSEELALLFSDGFKGTATFLPGRSTNIKRKLTAPPPPPPPPPNAAMKISSSSLPLVYCNAETQKTLTARDLFPDTQSLFPDVKLPNTSFASCTNEMRVNPKLGVRSACKRADGGQHVHNFTHNPVPALFPPISEGTGTSGTIYTKDYEDAKRYAYAYEVWRHRNEFLQQMQLDLARINDGVQYMRNLQVDDLEHAMKKATKISFFVFFPLVLLTTIILFSESAFYNAELKHLRLVDYDEWLKKQSGEDDRSNGTPKTRK